MSAAGRQERLVFLHKLLTLPSMKMMHSAHSLEHLWCFRHYPAWSQWLLTAKLQGKNDPNFANGENEAQIVCQVKNTWYVKTTTLTLKLLKDYPWNCFLSNAPACLLLGTHKNDDSYMVLILKGEELIESFIPWGVAGGGVSVSALIG